MTSRFDQFLAVDWSGAKGTTQQGIALALAQSAGPPELLKPSGKAWSRGEAMDTIRDLSASPVLIGIDMGISLPFTDAGAFFPGWDHSPDDAKSLWALVDAICGDDPNLECCGLLSHPEARQYFRHAKGDEGSFFHLSGSAGREGRFRVAEHAQRSHGVRPVSNFNLVGAAQVGKSTLTGMRMLHRLRDCVSVWPIDPVPESGAVLVEIYTSIAARAGGVGKGKTKIRDYDALNKALECLGSPHVQGDGAIDDHSSDALITAAWLRNAAKDPKYWQPAGLNEQIARTEGWTFGAV
ncbi:MAG: hypothetical protein ABJ239_02715 [Erythrobacter sp.]